MTLPEETRMPSPSMESGDPGTPYDESKHQWDINDTNLPTVSSKLHHNIFHMNPESEYWLISVFVSGSDNISLTNWCIAYSIQFLAIWPYVTLDLSM